jgi:hypothetical protein
LRGPTPLDFELTPVERTDRSRIDGKLMLLQIATANGASGRASGRKPGDLQVPCFGAEGREAVPARDPSPLGGVDLGREGFRAVGRAFGLLTETDAVEIALKPS